MLKFSQSILPNIEHDVIAQDRAMIHSSYPDFATEFNAVLNNYNNVDNGWDMNYMHVPCYT